MEQETTMTKEQSLALITEMINKARFNFSRGSFYFILWGVLLFLSAVYEYTADRVLDLPMPWIAWPIVGVIGGILSAVYSSRVYKDEPSSHLDRVYSSIWMVYFVTLILLIVAWVSNRINPGSYIMIVTGFPTFLTGYVLRFKPLQWGGVIFWTLGLISLFLFDEYRSLIFGVAMLLGYVVPGVMMRKIGS